MSDSGTSFAIDLPVQGTDGVLTAADALEKITSQMEAAGAASLRAAEAVKAQEAAYKTAETSADKAAKALEKITVAQSALRAKLDLSQKAGDAESAKVYEAALGKLSERHTEAKSKVDQMTAALRAEASTLDKLRAEATNAAKAEKQLAEQQAKAEKAAKADAAAQAAAAGSGKVNEAAEAFGKLGGPLGGAAQKTLGLVDGFKKLTGSLGALGPYAAVAVAITAIVFGLVALTAGMVAATFAAGQWAVTMADGARSARLQSDAIAGSVKGGRELDATIASLSKRVPLTNAELVDMATQLHKSGLEGKALTDTLEANAETLAKQKFGPDFQKQMTSLPILSDRLHVSFAKMFSGLNIDKLLEGLGKIVDLFDEDSAAAKAIKVVFESIFQPLIDGAAALLPKIRTAFIQFEIYALKALIAVKPHVSLLGYLAAGFGVLAAVVVGAVAVAFAVILGPIIALTVAIGAAIAATIWLTTKFIELGSAIVDGAGQAWEWLKGKFNEGIEYLQSIDLSEIGALLIQGLINGITGGAGGVVSAVSGVADSAIDAAKKALGIASPSTVFAEIGLQTAAGMSGGVDAGGGAVRDSLETMVAPPSPAAAPAGRGGGGGGISGGVFNFYGVKDAEHAADLFEQKMTLLFEGDAAQLGASPEPEPA